LNWQVFGPPVVGGYLAGDVARSNLVWIGATSLGVALQVLKLKYHLDSLKKEEQVIADRHYKFFGNHTEGDQHQRSVWDACKGEQEQIDRVLFGGGLY
jgi:hypothetical protein